jgi:hypothetical protein
MKLARKLIASAITITAVMAGATTALAATSSAAVPASAAAPAAARLALADSHGAQPETTNVANTFKWIYISVYNSLQACDSEGDYYIFYVNNYYTFKCVEITNGDFFQWDLYVGVPDPGAAIAAKSAATAARLTRSDSPRIANATWYYWATYGNLKNCDQEGTALVLDSDILTYECRQYDEGELFVYELWVILGQQH